MSLNIKRRNPAFSALVIIIGMLTTALLYGEAMYQHGLTHCEVRK